MKALTLNEIKSLVGKNNGPFFTVYTTVKEGTDINQNLEAAKEDGSEPMDSIISLPDLPLRSFEKLIRPNMEKIAV